MADIELVVKIPEKKYVWIKEHKGKTDFQITEMLYGRIQHGTPLPIGHGNMGKKSKAFENIENEFFKMAAELLHNGDEENAVKLASLIGRMLEVMNE